MVHLKPSREEKSACWRTEYVQEGEESEIQVEQVDLEGIKKWI